MASWKPQCLEENIKQQWRVHSFFSLERKFLTPATKALLQYGHVLRGSTQCPHPAKAQHFLWSGGWWVAIVGVPCHQQSRQIPRTSLHVRGNFHSIRFLTSAMQVLYALGTYLSDFIFPTFLGLCNVCLRWRKHFNVPTCKRKLYMLGSFTYYSHIK